MRSRRWFIYIVISTFNTYIHTTLGMHSAVSLYIYTVYTYILLTVYQYLEWSKNPTATHLPINQVNHARLLCT